MPGVQFTSPWALPLLLLFVPLAWLARHSLAGLSPSRRHWALAIRAAGLLLLIAALSGLQLVRAAKGTSVVYVLDRSESVADEQRQEALEFVRRAGQTMAADDSAGVVVTARRALVEQTPVARLELEHVASQPEPSFTDLSAGLRLGLAIARPTARRRLVLLTDGHENLGDALREARLADALEVPIDTVPLRPQAHSEVVAQRLVLPGEARRGDTVEPRVVVHSDTTTEARLTLLRDNVYVASTAARLSPGKNVVAFPPLVLADDGFHEFSAQVEAGADADRRNNRAVAFTFVRGRRKVLYVEGDAGQETYLARAMRAAGLDVKAVGPAGMPAALPALAGYDGLVLSNVSALDLSDGQMVLIRSAVRDLGVGLVAIGGDNSYGVGGYYQTPLEDALPVDMDIRKLRHLPNVGVVVVIDQSGSMAMTEGGTQKIQMANEAAIALVSLLGPTDRVAVIATDSVAKPVTGPALVPVVKKQFLIDEIARIRAGGGGIYCHAGLKKAAAMIEAAPTKLKHIILFADAADSEQQEHCHELVESLASRRITTSVVALGRETDVDVKFLKDVARLGKGRFYLTHRASRLPRIFTREAVLASRSQVVEKRFTPLLVTDLEPLAGIAALPPLRGYVATTAKPTAEVGLIAEQRYKDPVLAAWQYGLGRAVAFTSDCKARWAVDWLGWDGYAKFWSQTVRWTLRRARRGPFEARLVSRFQGGDEDATGSLRRGEARLVIDAVDEDGEFINGLTLRGTAVAPDGQAVELDVRQTAPGRYEAGFGTDQVGVWVVNVGGGKGDQSGSQTIGLALPYPPEYATTGTDEALLAGLAAASGGEVLSAPEAVFQPRGRAARTPIDVWPVCLVLALCLFPIDVAVRRVVIDPRRLRAVWAARRPVEPELERATSRLLAHKPGWRAAPVSPLPPPAESAPETSDAAAEQPVDEAPGSVTARLRAARRERLEGGPSEVEPDRPPERVSPPALGAAPTSATLARLKRARERMRRQGGEPPDETP